uniref:Uncharacterized protein n=1 Tax=Lotharella globosa TaxID=91324 RepID=A0A7S3YQG0_9EUKA
MSGASNNSITDLKLSPVVTASPSPSPASSPRGTSSSTPFRVPDARSALGRLVMLLEGCFTWTPCRFFARFCRSLEARLARSVAQSPRASVSDAQLSHVVAVVQLVAFGTGKFKGQDGTKETVLRTMYVLLKALAAALRPKRAEEAMGKLRVVFDFIMYLKSTRPKAVSAATEREMEDIVRGMPPEWRRRMQP